MTTPLGFLTCSHPTLSHRQASKVGLVHHHCGFLVHGGLRLLFLVVSAIQEALKEDQGEIRGNRRDCICFPSASSLKQ